MKITEAMVSEMAHHLTSVNQNDFYGALKAALAAAPKCSKGTPKSNFECVPMTAALDSSVWCIRCRRYLGEAS